MEFLKNMHTFANRLTKHFVKMLVNNNIDYSYEFKIICLPCLYLYSTLGGFSLLKKEVYGIQ